MTIGLLIGLCTAPVVFAECPYDALGVECAEQMEKYPRMNQIGAGHWYEIKLLACYAKPETSNPERYGVFVDLERFNSYIDGGTTTVTVGQRVWSGGWYATDESCAAPTAPGATSEPPPATPQTQDNYTPEPKENGPQNCKAGGHSQGNPINPANGNKYQHETDYVVSPEKLFPSTHPFQHHQISQLS